LVVVYGGLFDYSSNTEQVKSYAYQITSRAEKYRLILLLPSIHRSENPAYYTMAFDRYSFLSTTPNFYKRPDLKINLMINELKESLRSEGYKINEKIFVEGFSAGGMFAQRYCLLHPEKVQAISAGQCGGSLTLPVSSYHGIVTDWAVGVNDFYLLSGNNFPLKTFKSVPQYFYIGDKDYNNSHVQTPGNFWTQDQIDFLHKEFGATDPVRILNMAVYMKNICCNVTFKLYPNIGHEVSPWNTPNIIDDIYEFLNKQKTQTPPFCKEVNSMPWQQLLLE
jgi:pimeloyl-ACP methyl ester carboxylesterase